MANNFENNFIIPADVPKDQEQEFIKNYNLITHNTGKIMLFAGDQKIEHLHKDFYGPSIPARVNNPESLFSLADRGKIGALVTQLGLIARYGIKYPKINYIVKLNSKTDIILPEQKDPLSEQLWSVSDVIKLKKNSGLNICGVGYTVYIGSEFEHVMLNQAAQIISQAHAAGLVTILWMYPRGKHVLNQFDAKLIAGAAGVANCLGADFAKVNPPQASNSQTSAELLNIATQAAGNTKVICAGGKTISAELFLEDLYNQLNIGGTFGSATGRNIYQRSYDESIRLINSISALVYDKVDLKTALDIFERK